MGNNKDFDLSKIHPEPLLTASEVSYRLHLSCSSVYSLMQSGAIPMVHLGKSQRVRLQDLEAYIEHNIYSTETSS
jgi:excisionase family DNA binding protein